MIGLLALCLIATVVLVAAEWRHHDPTRVVSKSVASGAFVAAALVGGAAATGPGRAIVVALVLSMVGDLLLLSRDERMFLGGLGAFLLGHVAYVGAFAVLGLSPVGLLAALPAAAIAWGVWRWLRPNLGALSVPVAAYVTVISAMVVCAVAAAVAEPSANRLGLLGAAVLFYASDLCVARDRFVAPGPLNKTVGLPLYYIAQVLFAGFAATL